MVTRSCGWATTDLSPNALKLHREDRSPTSIEANARIAKLSCLH